MGICTCTNSANMPRFGPRSPPNIGVKELNRREDPALLLPSAVIVISTLLTVERARAANTPLMIPVRSDGLEPLRLLHHRPRLLREVPLEPVPQHVVCERQDPNRQLRSVV